MLGISCLEDATFSVNPTIAKLKITPNCQIVIVNNIEIFISYGFSDSTFSSEFLILNFAYLLNFTIMKNFFTLQTVVERLSTMLPLLGIFILTAPSSVIFPLRWQLQPVQAGTLEYQFEQTSGTNIQEKLEKVIASST